MKALRLMAAFSLLIVFGILISGCGKKALPIPRDIVETATATERPLADFDGAGL
jgi:hypothetical protein